MKTLLNARTLIRGYTDETTPDDWTNADLNSLINVYYHNIRAVVISTFEDYYLTTGTFNIVKDKQEYGSADGVATDIYKIRRVELNYDVATSGSAPTRMLPLTNIDEVRRDLGLVNATSIITTSAGNYYTYGFGSNFKIGFIPIPDEAGTNAAKIWYVKEAADLSADSDDIDIPYADKNYMAIVYGATAEALRFGQQDSPEATQMEAKYREAKTIIQEELEDKISEETKMVTDVSGGYF